MKGSSPRILSNESKSKAGLTLQQTLKSIQIRSALPKKPKEPANISISSINSQKKQSSNRVNKSNLPPQSGPKNFQKSRNLKSLKDSVKFKSTFDIRSGEQGSASSQNGIKSQSKTVFQQMIDSKVGPFDQTMNSQNQIKNKDTFVSNRHSITKSNRNFRHVVKANGLIDDNRQRRQSTRSFSSREGDVSQGGGASLHRETVKSSLIRQGSISKFRPSQAPELQPANLISSQLKFNKQRTTVHSKLGRASVTRNTNSALGRVQTSRASVGRIQSSGQGIISQNINQSVLQR